MRCGGSFGPLRCLPTPTALDLAGCRSRSRRPQPYLARTLVGSCPASAGAVEGLAELAQREERLERSRKREALWKHSFARNQLNLPRLCCFLSWPHLLWGICYSHLLRKENYTNFLPLLGSNGLLLVSPPPASLQLLLGDGPALETVFASRHQ